MSLKINILIVDDEIEIVNSFKETLEQFGIKHNHQLTIKVATNVLNALKILCKEKIDAIFLDYHFEGGMSGDELLHRLPTDINHLYIILISSDKELNEVVIKQHSQLDSDNFPFHFLTKPVATSVIESEYLNIVKFLTRLPFPYPLAHSLRKIANTETSQAKLTAIINFCEVLVKYLISILLTKVNNQNFQQFNFSNCLDILDNLLKDKDLSLDCDVIIDINELFKIQLSNQKILLEFLLDLEKKSRELNQVYPESYYKKILENIEPLFNDLKQRLILLTRYYLIVIKESKIDEKQPIYKYKSYILMGLDTYPKIKNFISKDKLEPEKVYLNNGLDNFLCLDPFIIKYCLCEDCREDRIFMLNEIQNETETLVYRGFCNHELREKILQSSLSTTVTFEEKRSKKMSKFEYDVFICHSSKDKPFIMENIIAEFKKQGIKYWFDAEQITPVDFVTQKIEEGLQNSQYIMPCLSENFTKTGWTRAEYGGILNAEFSGKPKRITVIMLDNCNDNDIPPLLIDKRKVRFSNKKDFEEFIEFLKS